jgi:two-component system, OmpR family, sensor kinase
MSEEPRKASRWSARARILGSMLLVATIGVVFAGAVTFLVQRDRSLSEIDARLIGSVEAARLLVSGNQPTTVGGSAVAADPVPLTTTRAALNAVLQSIVPSHDESSLAIIDGIPAMEPGVEIDFQISDVPGLVDKVVAETADGAVHLDSIQAPFGSVRYIAVPVSVSGDPEQGIYVVASNVNEELQELYSSFTTYAGVAALSLVAIGLVGWFVAGRLLRPVRDLASTASRVTGSALGERIPVRGTDDVSDLGRTVNEMLDRLDAAMTGQRQLLDDVRHELKTPITIVRGHLELLDPEDIKEVESTRALAIDELDRMAGLVDDIETYAETQTAVPIRTPITVTDLTTSVFSKVKVLPGHTWTLAEVASGTIAIDVARVTQAWLQLADNAKKYSPSDSQILVGSSIHRGILELWVADEGPGIPDGMESRIFERFGRIDTGRGIRGSGLGLPIVRAIARSHGGAATVRRQGTGSRFSIELPMEGQQ